MKSLNIIFTGTVLAFFLLLSTTSLAQLSLRISSKATCSSMVTVTWINPTQIPNIYDTTVSLGIDDVGVAYCPSCIGPNWILCSIVVNFADGSNIIFNGPGCVFTPQYNGPFNCFTIGSGYLGSGGFSYY